MIRKSIAHLLATLCLLCILISACNNRASQPAGSVSEINGVTVSKLNETEVDQLLTVSKLPAQDCTQTSTSKICTIEPSQVLKWGWGLCANDAATLRSKVSQTQVELIVDSVRILKDMIYQRDEIYDRQENAYCHVWLIKLNRWQSGSTVKLENKATTSVFDTQRNIFVMNVK